MENQKQTIDNLVNAMFDYMRYIHRSEGTISRYRFRWQKVKDFMLNNRIKYYDTDVEKAYLTSVLGDFDYNDLNQKEKVLVNVIEVLTEFQKTGRIIMGPRKHHPKLFKGDIGRIFTDFINYRENELKLSKNTIQSYVIYLYPFYRHMNSTGLKNISDIKSSDILFYIGQMDPNTSAKKHVALNTLRIFFRYLHEHYILPVDYSRIIPKDNYKNQPKLPSTFTDGEIDALLKAVDRGNPKGKRDYAILLLATKLGLRASDICELKFENINWERNIIMFNQYKTGRALELPLLPEIGNAIIDYLKHGRPVSQDSNCFIHVQPPYDKIHTSDLGNLVRRYITLAGINCSNRKHGPHALRHCFASALLKEKVPLPVLSEALGHKNMASSMFYLRIDINSLRKCALEVPSIPSSFYEQKGGYLHE
ncbi:MAG: tyrosine-type recombinase/integrase [Paludibacteraceae bacterium]